MFRTTALLLFCASLLVSRVSAQTELAITAAEVYLDVDPGMGLGTPLPATDGSFNGVFEPLSGGAVPVPVQEGMHVLWMRARDGNEEWGPSFGIVVVIDTTMLDTGMPEPAPTVQMRIVPDPVLRDGVVTAHLPQALPGARLFVRDASGRTVRDLPTGGAQQVVIELSGLTAGNYLVQCIMGGLVYSRPLVIVQ